jgi:hypothetical protein
VRARTSAEDPGLPSRDRVTALMTEVRSAAGPR